MQEVLTLGLDFMIDNIGKDPRQARQGGSMQISAFAWSCAGIYHRKLCKCQVIE